MRKFLVTLSLLLTLLLVACKDDDRQAALDRLEQTLETPLFEAYPADKTGIRFNENGQLLYPGDNSGLLSNISGVAVGDINNDGLPDLFFSGGPGNSALYLNEGDFRFRDITQSAGINDAWRNNAGNEGVNMVDINGDGWLDIYILKRALTGKFKKQEFNRDGANLLFINQQNNTFKEAAAEYGLDLIGLSHTANFFDYDADGDLDVYMAYTAEPGAAFSFPYYKSPPQSRWLNDQFLENKNGRFVDVRQKAGFPFERNIALSVSVGDINNDGYGDIYVANDFFGRDFFYINNGDKTFTKSLNDYFTKTPMSAMGSDFADINNDGWLDLFVGEMMPVGHQRQKLNLVPFSIEIYNKLLAEGKPQYTRNMLQLNQNGKRFRDIGLLAGVHATEWSWSSFFFDADNDGYKDLYVANGILRDFTNMDYVKNNFGDDYTKMADPKEKVKANTASAPIVKNPNFIYRNKGDHTFEEMHKSWGMSQVLQTRGATYADLDLDGDLDLILNNMDESPLLYRNRSDQAQRGNYLRLRLKARGSNTFGIGARVELHSEGQFQMDYLSNQRGYQSCPEPILHFGLGQMEKVDSLIIYWPGGEQELLLNVKANQLLEIQQGEGQAFTKESVERRSLFAEQAATLDFQHREKPYIDFRRERLLIRGYSQEGPGIAIADVNGDGLDDCFVGGAAGQAGQLFFQSPNGTMKAAPSQPWASAKASEDMGVVFFDANADGAPDLFIASGSNELAGRTDELSDRLYLNNGQGAFRLSDSYQDDQPGYSCAVAAADFDQDGDQDLFIGGRLTAGNYAQLPASKLLRNDNGQWTDMVKELAPELAQAGRITSAIWTDANQDGELDLAVVGEWMPLTFFYQTDGRFTKAEVAGSEGWWNSIIGADLDADGDMDYICGNQGTNTIFKASIEKPLTLLSGDFDKNGQPDPVVFKYTDGVNAPFVNRDIFTSQMPYFNNRFYNFQEYAKADIDNLFDEAAMEAAEKSYVYELQSGVFLNEKDGFRFIALPVKAQMAPVFGIMALDLNEDEHIDLLLGGNTASNHYEYGSIDALNGLVLRGDGKGQFQSVATRQSGVDLPGHVRSMAYYMDSKGQLKVAIGNNDAATQVLTCKQSTEHIEIPAEATQAIVQLKGGQQRRYEFYQGGGYLSQSGRELILPPGFEKVTFYQHNEALK